MTTTTEASTEPCFCRQGAAAHFAYGAIVALLDRDPDVDTMRRNLRYILAEFRRAGIGVSA